MRHILLILPLLFFSTSAIATEKEVVEQEKPSHEDVLLQDWLGLIKVLRSHGVHQSQVSWRSIEELCLGLKTEKDKVPYNRCRLEKAIAQVHHREDSAECNQEAEAEYPDRLRHYTPELIVAGTEQEKGEATEFTNTHVVRAPISTRELRNKRAVVFRACMRTLGWRDPDNWRTHTKD